ncbi:DUF6230 family protein [Janibacter sp. GS2]|uniref:DUF6230 family protein n=1 Tax=Janibacter sp. GS2 TaxID=3442646 RepID=UPI003EC07D6E
MSPRTPHGHTSLRAALTATVVGMLALALTATGTKERAVALDVTFQERPSQFSTSGLKGTDVAFATVPADVSDGRDGTKQVSVLRGGFAGAELDGLCISQQQELLGGTFTMRVTAGDGTTGEYDIDSASATFDLTEVEGGEDPGIALGGVVQIGQTASDVTTVAGLDNPLAAPGSGRYLAISSSAGELSDVRGTVYGFSIDDVATIPGLVVEIVPGDRGCDSLDLPT